MESAIVAGMLAAINGAIARDAGVSSCTSTREEDEQDDEGVRRRGRRRNSKRKRHERGERWIRHPIHSWLCGRVTISVGARRDSH